MQNVLPPVSVDTSGDSSVNDISGLAVNYKKKTITIEYPKIIKIKY